MSTWKFCLLFLVCGIGLSFLLSLAIGKILRWVDSEPGANEPRA